MIGTLVYVVHEYPARTQTFVQREIHSLRSQSQPVYVYPLHGDKQRLRVLRALMGHASVQRVRSATAELKARSVNLREIPRQLYAMAHGVNLARCIDELGTNDVHIHAHFVARCTDVAAYARIFSNQRRITTSATGHAGDVISPPSERALKRRVYSLDGVVSASNAVNTSLSQKTGRAGTVIHCGVASVPPWRKLRSDRATLNILTIARLVEKKNISILVDVAALLAARDIAVAWRVIGDGPMRNQLETQRNERGLESLVFDGHLNGTETLRALEDWADVFVLTPVPASSGDVDGIPVALMEAMAMSVPVISSDVGGVTELVTQGETGWLVDARNPVEIADAIEQTIRQTDATQAMTLRAHELVVSEFRSDTEATKLARFFSDVHQSVQTLESGV